MTNKDAFHARLARLKTEADAGASPHSRPATPKAKAAPKTRPGLKVIILPAVSLAVLGLGVFLLSQELGGGTASPFDLKASIRANMSEEKREKLGQDPEIERELQKRKFADPDLARLILSN